MDYAYLGNTDVKVSKICLGTMTFGEQNTEEEGHEQLDYALDHEVNFIDTAEMYPVPGRSETQGRTEEIIGTWIQKRKNRDAFILASKVVGPTNMTWIRENAGFKSNQIQEAIEGSLRRLQTDYLDLYQLHWPERPTTMFGVRNYPADKSDRWEDNFQAVLTKMQSLVEEGKIRYFGLSNETPWGTMHFLKMAEKYNLPRCVSIQNPYNLLNRHYEVGLSEVSMMEKVGLLAYSPMAFGLLSGKYEDGTDTSFSRLNQFKQMSRYDGTGSRAAAKKYIQLAKDHQLSPAQMSLAFINDQPFVTSNIIGATDMIQLKDNIESIQVKLTHEILKEINAIHEEIPNPSC